MQRNKDSFRPVMVMPTDDLRNVRLLHDRFPGWVFRVRFGEIGEVIGFSVEESAVHVPDRRPLNAAFVHAIPVGAAISKAKVAASFLSRSRARNTTGDEAASLATWGEMVRERTGTRGKADVVYALVAAEYVRLIETENRAPLKTLAAAMVVSESQVRNSVSEARKRGLLTPTKPGKKGGRMTAKGLRTLEVGDL
jgi:hypothetical protein